MGQIMMFAAVTGFVVLCLVLFAASVVFHVVDVLVSYLERK